MVNKRSMGYYIQVNISKVIGKIQNEVKGRDTNYAMFLTLLAVFLEVGN